MVFTPGWRRIGLLAPLLIVTSRLIQGFSVGGELGSSTALLIESAPPERRGLLASWQGTGQSVAALAAASAAVLVTTMLTPAQLSGWGWRLPFVVGLLIGPIGLYIRANVHEPDAIVRRLHAETAPLHDLFIHHAGPLLRTICLISMGTMATYILQLNMPAYAHRELGLPLGATYLSSVIADLAAIIVSPFAGSLSDRYGARRVMLPAAIVLGLGVFPSFVLLTAHPSTLALILIQTASLAVLAFLSGPIYGLIGSLFPPEVRSSGLSVGYNVSVLLFGGFAPFITTWLIAVTGDRHMPGLYVTAGAVISLSALLIRWPRGERLPEGAPPVRG
jgi:MHS family proline/betaine transporter-like MFS transporter